MMASLRPWGKLPKALVGLYLLYAAFAAWHFELPWWLVLVVALGGTVLLAFSKTAINGKPSLPKNRSSFPRSRACYTAATRFAMTFVLLANSAFAQTALQPHVRAGSHDIAGPECFSASLV
jgi:hypothetical protein